MDTRPFVLRLIPGPLRRWVKEKARPYGRRFIEAYFDHALVPPAPPPSLPPLPTTEELGRFAKVFAYSPFAEGKCIPIFGDKQAYILPKAARDTAGSPDGIPVPPAQLWTDCDSAEIHLRVGKDNTDRMRALLAASGCDIRPGQRVLDLGCAAGPMLRRLKDFKESCELWGVDISSEHVQWCMQNFPRDYRWAVTTTAAHLPFEDRFFDLIYCGSVFSHMGESCDAWLLELARVIKPGGTLYLTMVTKEAMQSYLTHWESIGLSKDVRAAFTPEQINSDFDVMVVGRSPWMHAIYDIEFFKRKCEQAFDVLSITPNVYTFQYALVLRRRETRPGDHGAVGAEAVVKQAKRSAAMT
jgi:ubiquinone/menaquinone biosynthesis C-methylase UbiE